MPYRVIREGLLDSDRYWSLPSDSARLLFIHLLLLADDFGCLNLSYALLRRRCYDSRRPPENEQIEAELAALEAADLLRRYNTNGSKYGFIPRFGQRLRRSKLSYPQPPRELWINDEAAAKFLAVERKKTNEIRHEDEILSDKRQTNVIQVRSDVSQAAPLAGERKGKEIERKTYTVTKDDQKSYPQIPKTLIEQIRHLPAIQQAEAVAEFERRAAANPELTTEQSASTNPTSTPDEKFKD